MVGREFGAELRYATVGVSIPFECCDPVDHCLLETQRWRLGALVGVQAMFNIKLRRVVPG